MGVPAHVQTRCSACVQGWGGEHMCSREINSLIWGFLFVYMINTAPVTREILSVLLQTAGLVQSLPTALCWHWNVDGEKVHLVSPAGLEGALHRARKVCGHSAESWALVRQRLGGFLELVVEGIEFAMRRENGNKTGDGVWREREALEEATEMYLRDERMIRVVKEWGFVNIWDVWTNVI